MVTVTSGQAQVYEYGGLKNTIPHGLHRNEWKRDYNAKPAGLATDSTESKPKRGGRRLGASRRPNIAMRLLRGLNP